MYGLKSFKTWAASKPTLKIYLVREVGDQSPTRRRPPAQKARVSFDVSEREWDDFPGQAEDAIAFLATHFDDLRAVIDSHDVEFALLDFPIFSRLTQPPSNVQCDILPKELVRLAGLLGLAIEMSQYPALGKHADELEDDDG